MAVDFFREAWFVKSAMKPEDYPSLVTKKQEIMPEVAFVGRSNVGKSSLMNMLFGTKGLVKVAKTAGKTQALQFFSVKEEICFVDLPGYGYASVQKSVRASWGPMIDTYLKKRQQLKLVLLLLDIRRDLTDDDINILSFFAHEDIPYRVVFTKADKLSKNELGQKLRLIEQQDTAIKEFVLTSSIKGVGRKELCALIRNEMYG